MQRRSKNELDIVTSADSACFTSETCESFFYCDVFHSPAFFPCYGFFLRFLCSFLCWGGMGDEHGSILSFCILGVFAFWPFLGTFLGSVAIWAFLKY